MRLRLLSGSVNGGPGAFCEWDPGVDAGSFAASVSLARLAAHLSEI